MMASHRGKSVPPRTGPPGSSSSSLGEITNMSTPNSLSSFSSQPYPPNAPPSNSKLLPRAETLAKMTAELNIRKIEAQTNDLQKRLQDLVQATAGDKEFRKENEERLTKLWQEMLAVRQQVTKMEGEQNGIKADLGKCQQMIKEVTEELWVEIRHLREVIDWSSRLMDTLTRRGVAVDESSYGSLPGDSAKTQTMAETQRIEDSISQKQKETETQQPPKPQDAGGINKGIEHRIQEAVKSTRRWNRDHKTTELPDSVFCANYLKQQSKRDASLAVVIQRSIGKRVGRRLPRSRSRPSTLEEFCEDVTWQDVLDTVQEMLMERKQYTIRAAPEEEA